MSTKLLHIILFVLLSVIILVDRYTEQHKRDQAQNESAYIQAKEAADAAVVFAAQMPEPTSAETSQQSEKRSKYAPPPTNIESSKNEVEIPPDPAEGESMEIFGSREGQVVEVDCQGKNVDLLPDGGEFTLVGDCPFVRVIGPSLRVNIQRAGVLKVYGPESTVQIGQVNFIEVVAPDAHVVYGTALNPNAKVVARVIGPNSSAIRH